MLHFWVNLEGARIINDVLGIGAPWTRIATALVFPFRLLFVLLGFIGLYVIWIEQRASIFRGSDGLDFARLCSLMVLFRTGELGGLGIFLAGGLMETRYAIVALPAMLMVAAVGLRRVVELASQRNAAPVGAR